MSSIQGRSVGAGDPSLSEGWTLRRPTRPSRLMGANGIRAGADGRIYVAQVAGSKVCANPITLHKGRLYTGDFLPDGRIPELDTSGGLKRVILEHVPLPNVFEVGPDGLLYFPVQGANEIWRVKLESGEPEVVTTGPGIPDSVKFDSEGNIVSTQVASGRANIWCDGPTLHG